LNALIQLLFKNTRTRQLLNVAIKRHECVS